MPGKLRDHWERYRNSFRTRTHDTSELAYTYLRGQFTMDQDRHFAGIARQIKGQDGQALQHFMSNSPWSADDVYQQIQTNIRKRPNWRKAAC